MPRVVRAASDARATLAEMGNMQTRSQQRFWRQAVQGFRRPVDVSSDDASCHDVSVAKLRQPELPPTPPPLPISVTSSPRVPQLPLSWVVPPDDESCRLTLKDLFGRPLLTSPWASLYEPIVQWQAFDFEKGQEWKRIKPKPKSKCVVKIDRGYKKGDWMRFSPASLAERRRRSLQGQEEGGTGACPIGGQQEVAGCTGAGGLDVGPWELEFEVRLAERGLPARSTMSANLAAFKSENAARLAELDLLFSVDEFRAPELGLEWTGKGFAPFQKLDRAEVFVWVFVFPCFRSRSSR